MGNNIFIDFLKIVTLLLVIIGHNNFLFASNSNNFVNYLFTNINPIIYSFHMPLFFMLSGGVYKICLNNGKYYIFHDLVINKYHRLIKPYIITSTFIVFPVYYITNKDLSIIDVLIQTITSQNAQHLWFIFDLFIIFILLYYPIKYLSNYIILPTLLVINVIPYISNIIVIQRFFIYSIWFYLGFILLEKITSRKYNFFSALLSISVFFVFYFSYNKIEYGNLVLKNAYFFLLSFSGCISLIFFSNVIINNIGNKILSSSIYNNLKTYSFDIYLYSCPIQIIYVSLFKYKILPYPTTSIYSILLYLLEFIIAIAIPIIFVKLLNFSRFHR